MDFKLHFTHMLPSVVFSYKTLVVLKLAFTRVAYISSVDFPLLKILHLFSVSFSGDLDLSQLLPGCPNLEDLEAKGVACKIKGKFNRLPELVRASIDGHFPLEIVKDVEVLFIDWIYHQNLDFEFQNLVQLKLTLGLRKDWFGVLEVLKHCPKLQTLVIYISNKVFYSSDDEGHEEVVWQYPQIIPACISLHLKTCCLEGYKGSADELQFERYITSKRNSFHCTQYTS
ncbi:F-box/FBD/LRR-repeat protein At4g26340-like [Vigna unguiculata]|uniref:F-box/FBD/LRR-repeat protein At4g26340-like n=1 Tax=Vigna unguiculata TaxID=3917 RepID=UPI00101646E1|nr:F-box/FBD/LRR-repeat protein At4g26340-like [Vigna unguiculata]